MFKNILVASDGSKCGDKAVDLAIDLASKYGAKISALYVMDFALDFSYDDLDDAGGAVLDDITAKGKEKDVVVVEHIWKFPRNQPTFFFFKLWLCWVFVTVQAFSSCCE